MNETAFKFEMTDQLTFQMADQSFQALLSGALYWPAQDALLIADLHLEKGSAFAQRGQFLPPYDSIQSLKTLKKDIERLNPAHVICLGDSFHDLEGHDRLPDDCRLLLSSFMQARQWHWISGNHDPLAPTELGGQAHRSISMDGVGLTHEPGSLIAHDNDQESDLQLEIAGHLHPVARISNAMRGRSLRRRVFVLCDRRIILPAYGSFTGGLNVREEAFSPFLERSTNLIAIGRQTLTRHALSAAKKRNAR